MIDTVLSAADSSAVHGLSSWDRPADLQVRTETMILGGGLAGLAAGSLLDERAIVVEAEDRPGGLVRSERIGEYWFDHVIHLLYFSDPEVAHRVHDLLGDLLQPCPPRAWVETAEGAARFPVQLNLSSLPAEVRAACIRDMREAHSRDDAATDYQELLLGAFGRTLCELFFFPYNQKLWKRPLADLSVSGFHWNLTRPGIDEVERGAAGRPSDGYNAEGWYPRPCSADGVRGMEILSEALASRVADLRTSHTVLAIDTDRRVVRTSSPHGVTDFYYTRDCVSTLPLPTTIELCSQAAGTSLVAGCRTLPRNRVRSVALAVRGPRPSGTGHWRYYTRQDVPFTRLVFMTEFDPAMAPPDGWGLLAEIVEPSEDPMAPEQDVIRAAQDGVRLVGLLPQGTEVIGARVITCDPGYVVFTDDAHTVADEAKRFLDERGVTLLGRYGSWTYLSMSQVMGEAFAWATSRVTT